MLDGSATGSSGLSPLKKHPRGKGFEITEKMQIIYAYETLMKDSPAGGVTAVVSKVASRFGVGKSSVYRILSEYRSTGKVKSPRKLKPKIKTILNTTDDFTKTSIKKKVHEFYLRNEIPTLDKIMAVVNEDTSIGNFSRTTLYRLLLHIGYKFEKGKKTSCPDDGNDVIMLENANCSYSSLSSGGTPLQTLEVKTEATSWVSESLSEDSSHSGYPSVIPDETRQGTSSSVDIASLPGTSSMNLDPLLAQSSIDNVSLKSEPIEMTPPRLTSRSASPGVQSTTVNQSLNARQQNSSCETRPVSDVQASADLKSKQLDKLLLETNGVDAALDSLEVISKQVNQLDGRDDHFDNFGRYVASLLRSLPTERAVDLQQEVIKLILRSDTCQEISPVDLDSTLTPSSINVSPSTSAPEKVDTHRSPPPPPRPPERLTPSRITPSTVESINVDKSLPLSQQNKRGEKRPCADDSLCEVQTKQSKFDDLLHETEQIDAALKRLQNICNQIDQLCGREDQFDDFGRYTASLLRRFNSKRAVELQEKTINLILRAYISASAVR